MTFIGETIRKINAPKLLSDICANPETTEIKRLQKLQEESEAYTNGIIQKCYSLI